MCEFCESTEVIEREIELNKNSDLKLSLRHDSENKLLKMRAQIGSLGYTVPIKANYCMFCGEKIKYDNNKESAN